MGGAREGGMITVEEHEELLAKSRKEIITTLRNSIMGAIQDLRAGDERVQVMMFWSREFYDMIEKEGKP